MKQHLNKILWKINLLVFIYQLTHGYLRFIGYVAYGIAILMYIIFITIATLLQFFVIISVEIPSCLWINCFAVDRTLNINYTNKKVK